MNDIQKLQEIKEEIEKAKISKAKSEGVLDNLIKQLKSDFDCDNSGKAKRKLETFNSKIETIQSELDAGIEELKEEYDGW